MNNPQIVFLSNLFDENNLVTAPENPNKKNILVVVDNSLTSEDFEIQTKALSNKATVKFTYVSNINKEIPSSLYDAILSGVIGNSVPCDLDLYSAYIKLLTSGGILIVKTENGTEENSVKRLKMCGFLNVTSNTPGIIIGHTPSYKVGSSDKVTINSETKENIISAWKLDDNNSEIISEDDLLEADDLKKPDSTSLKVCATTKKAKACKNCSCGLAEELEANRLKDLPKQTPDTSNAKSSCGSCYLGDAFRCASCPYLGMPAFKPGEKVQLAGNLLQDDF